MRCSCKHCGTYMAQTEHGLRSGCECPDCGNRCEDCMGSASGPLTGEQLRERFGFIGNINAAEGEAPAPEDFDENRADWRKLL